ncbi:MAG TPA: hypothetical protein VGS61_03195, partial [Acidimicrobiales bacterium]|nr:hypothetical protein [Acidimicrobiales bacterium]
TQGVTTMLINEIGVRDESEVVDLQRFRDDPDPKSRESLTTILASALAAEGPMVEVTSASVIEIASSPAVEPGSVGHAA